MQQTGKPTPEHGHLMLNFDREIWSASESVLGQLNLPLHLGNNNERPLQEFLDLLHKDDKPLFQEAIQAPTNTEVRFLKHVLRIFPLGLGRVLHADLEGYLRSNDKGQFVEFFGCLSVQKGIVGAGSLLDQYFELLNYSSDLLVLLDKDLKYIAVNNAYCDLWNEPREYFLNITISELFSRSPEHFKNIIKPLLEQCLQGESVKLEQWISPLGFESLYVEMNYFPFLNDAGEVSGIMIQGINKTEVMETIEMLERSEALLNRSMQIANMGGWYFDVNSGEIEWTDEMYAIHEVGKDFMRTSENMDKFIPENDKKEVMRCLELALQGTPYDMVSGMVTAKGTPKTVRSVAFPLVENGKVVRIEGVLQDITQAMEIQSGLDKAVHSLESQKYILDQHAIVTITDKNGLITSANEKFIEITGYSEKEVLGKRHREIQSNLQSNAFYEELWSTIKSGQDWQGEARGKTKQGSLYWLYTTVVPVLNEDGVIEEFISVSTDITELKSTEASLRKAQKMDAIGQLTGGIAHDFNNLLSIIIGNIELMELAHSGDEQVDSHLSNAKSAALRGAVLTRRLLNFSHQAPVVGDAVNLNTVLNSLEVLISKSLTTRVKVMMNLNDDLSLVEVDQGDFEDAIINLSINANDAMPEGGTLLFSTRNHEVSIEDFKTDKSLPPGHYVEIKVSDTGIGMSEQVRDKIFEPYFTMKSSDKGSGLGLSMVYGFVQRSKGMISVDSSPGTGACFSIYLPKSEQQTEHTIGFDAQMLEPQMHRATHNEKILLVDDEIEIVKINTMQLQELGYRVVSSNSGEEALRALKDNKDIDLMFTDVMMPGRLNGFDLAEEALKLRPELKILFTTGYAKVQEGVKKEIWRNNILPKPYRGETLSKRIRDILDK